MLKLSPEFYDVDKKWGAHSYFAPLTNTKKLITQTGGDSINKSSNDESRSNSSGENDKDNSNTDENSGTISDFDNKSSNNIISGNSDTNQPCDNLNTTEQSNLNSSNSNSCINSASLENEDNSSSVNEQGQSQKSNSNNTNLEGNTTIDNASANKENELCCSSKGNDDNNSDLITVSKVELGDNDKGCNLSCSQDKEMKNVRLKRKVVSDNSTDQQQSESSPWDGINDIQESTCLKRRMIENSERNMIIETYTADQAKSSTTQTDNNRDLSLMEISTCLQIEESNENANLDREITDTQNSKSSSQQTNNSQFSRELAYSPCSQETGQLHSRKDVDERKGNRYDEAIQVLKELWREGLLDNEEHKRKRLRIIELRLESNF